MNPIRSGGVGYDSQLIYSDRSERRQKFKKGQEVQQSNGSSDSKITRRKDEDDDGWVMLVVVRMMARVMVRVSMIVMVVVVVLVNWSWSLSGWWRGATSNGRWVMDDGLEDGGESLTL